MKLCGHTMGTPEKDIYQAISFFAELGLEGIEVRCADNGHINPETISDAEVERIAAHAREQGVAVACLTPYYRDFMTEEATRATLAGYRRTFEVARGLGCGLVRAISGTWPQQGHERCEVFERALAGMARAGDLAAEHGIRLAVETHSGQLTFSAAEAAEFIEALDHPAVGVLWDHYWTYVADGIGVAAALELIGPRIIHVHAKNVRYDDEGGRQTTLLDDGELDWCEVVAGLAGIGYDGYISDEYEKYWKPELPEPEVGMRRNAEVLRECLSRLG
ncbi:MAG TPA: sugar phosphate isomerase/epimerase family protein [Armatimonadota bacterium]|nr:sugar phosphate isomerase/epimerase family protein [Armatimonadota bacterium]